MMLDDKTFESAVAHCRENECEDCPLFHDPDCDVTLETEEARRFWEAVERRSAESDEPEEENDEESEEDDEGERPYEQAAWMRISELAGYIEKEYEHHCADTRSVTLWAREIVLQCAILEALARE